MKNFIITWICLNLGITINTFGQNYLISINKSNCQNCNISLLGEGIYLLPNNSAKFVLRTQDSVDFYIKKSEKINYIFNDSIYFAVNPNNLPNAQISLKLSGKIKQQDLGIFYSTTYFENLLKYKIAKAKYKNKILSLQKEPNTASKIISDNIFFSNLKEKKIILYNTQKKSIIFEEELKFLGNINNTRKLVLGGTLFDKTKTNDSILIKLNIYKPTISSIEIIDTRNILIELLVRYVLKDSIGNVNIFPKNIYIAYNLQDKKITNLQLDTLIKNNFELGQIITNHNLNGRIYFSKYDTLNWMNFGDNSLVFLNFNDKKNLEFIDANANFTAIDTLLNSKKTIHYQGNVVGKYFFPTFTNEYFNLNNGKLFKTPLKQKNTLKEIEAYADKHFLVSANSSNEHITLIYKIEKDYYYYCLTDQGKLVFKHKLKLPKPSMYILGHINHHQLVIGDNKENTVSIFDVLED